MFTDIEKQLLELLKMYPKVYLIDIEISHYGMKYRVMFNDSRALPRTFETILQMIEFLDKH